MTVYVDDAGIPATVGRTTSRWSHLTADTPDELHAFAARLGLRRDWYQTCKTRCVPAGQACVHWHYDLTARRRARAVELGATEITLRDMGQICRARRDEQRRTQQ